MTVDLRKFFQACNLAKTLMVGNPEERKYYIDFSSGSSERTLGEPFFNIFFLYVDNPSGIEPINDED